MWSSFFSFFRKHVLSFLAVLQKCSRCFETRSMLPFPPASSLKVNLACVPLPFFKVQRSVPKHFFPAESNLCLSPSLNPLGKRVRVPPPSEIGKQLVPHFFPPFFLHRLMRIFTKLSPPPLLVDSQNIPLNTCPFPPPSFPFIILFTGERCLGWGLSFFPFLGEVIDSRTSPLFDWTWGLFPSPE